MGRTPIGPVALLCALALTPCFAGKVITQVGKDADFSRYKTYQWLPTRLLAKTGLIENDPAFTALVKEAVNRELDKRGMREVSEGGDLQIATTGFSVSVPQVEALITTGGGDPLFGTQPIGTVGRYNKEGTLVVNLIDSRTKRSAWAGMVTDSLDNKPGSGSKKISKGTADLFKKYPVQK
jgi:hypothetical protein